MGEQGPQGVSAGLRPDGPPCPPACTETVSLGRGRPRTKMSGRRQRCWLLPHPWEGPGARITGSQGARLSLPACLPSAHLLQALFWEIREICARRCPDLFSGKCPAPPGLADEPRHLNGSLCVRHMERPLVLANV